MISKNDDRRDFERKRDPPGRRPTLANLMDFQREAYEGMLVDIRLGAYDYQAAEKMGVTARSFARWMDKGQGEYQSYQDLAEQLEQDEEASNEEKDVVWEESYKPSCYCQFFQDVMRVKAEARTLREAQVATETPFQWLRYGPGRTRPDREGWTDFRESEMNVLVNTQVDSPRITVDTDGKELVGNVDLVDTMEVLADAGLLPSMNDMSKALLNRREGENGDENTG